MCFCGSFFFATTFLESDLFTADFDVDVFIFLDAVVTVVLFAVTFTAVFLKAFEFSFYRDFKA